MTASQSTPLAPTARKHFSLFPLMFETFARTVAVMSFVVLIGTRIYELDSGAPYALIAVLLLATVLWPQHQVAAP